MIKKGLSRLGIYFLYLISLLPFWILYRIADVLFVLLYYVIRYRRKVVQENLSHAFPDKTEPERVRIEKLFYQYLADLIVETIKSITISEKQLRKRIYMADPEMIPNYHAQGKSVIAVGGHYCNWELAGLNFCLYTDRKFMIVYKPLSNLSFDRFFLDIRSRFGTIMVPMKQTLRKILTYKNEPTTIALLGDQTPTREDTTYFTNFLNQPTAVFLGVEKLARATDSVVMFYDMKRIKRGYYSCTLVSLAENPKQTEQYEITEMHTKHLEKTILCEPQYWLWSHRRWKFKPEDIH